MSENIILVTGGAGYIGSHTIVALTKLSGFKIISVDNYSNSSPETYKRIKEITGITIDHIEADLSIKMKLKRYLKI